MNTKPVLSVLCVDDDLDWQDMMKSYFKGTDMAFVSATNGEEALKALSLHKFAIVFMDLKMPKVDGFEATEILRSIGYKNAIVAVSADVIPGTREQVESLGFTDHLQKPTDREKVMGMIYKHAKIEVITS